MRQAAIVSSIPSLRLPSPTSFGPPNSSKRPHYPSKLAHLIDSSTWIALKHANRAQSFPNSHRGDKSKWAKGDYRFSASFRPNFGLWRFQIILSRGGTFKVLNSVKFRPNRTNPSHRQAQVIRTCNHIAFTPSQQRFSSRTMHWRHGAATGNHNIRHVNNNFGKPDRVWWYWCAISAVVRLVQYRVPLSQLFIWGQHSLKPEKWGLQPHEWYR